MVVSVAASSKFYRLPPVKENAEGGGGAGTDKNMESPKWAGVLTIWQKISEISDGRYYGKVTFRKFQPKIEE